MSGINSTEKYYKNINEKQRKQQEAIIGIININKHERTIINNCIIIINWILLNYLLCRNCIQEYL